MAELSSINFKKTNLNNLAHNERITPPSYAIGGEILINRSMGEARALKETMINRAMETYTARTGQKFQSKSYEWSAVVNLKPSSTMAELEKLAAHLQEKYGFQCYQIAIHRDEGHINEQGEKVLNHHAHLEFITLDKETGKNNFRRELIKHQTLRDMQGEVAEILQMQRGVDKRLSGAKRIEPRAYAKMKEREKKELQSIKYKHTKEISEIKSLAQKFVKERIEQERKAWIKEQGHTKEEYAKLRALNEQDFKTIQELEITIQNLNSQIKAKNEQIFALNQKNDELHQKNNEIDLRAENELLKHENENLKFLAEKMSDEITLLKHKQNERVFFIDEVKEIIAYKDELDKTSQNLNDDINLNRYENSIDKQKTFNEMLAKATKTKQMLDTNPQLESLFSFEKYKKVCERFTKWLKDKGFTQEKSQNLSR